MTDNDSTSLFCFGFGFFFMYMLYFMFYHRQAKMTNIFLDMIINPTKSKTCFLCFRQRTHLRDIHSDLVIVENDHEFTVSVWKMMAQLFPHQEVILHEVCDMCSNTILNIYILIRRHEFMKETLLRVVENLEKQVSRVKKVDKCYLKISLDHETNTSMDEELKSAAIESLDCVQCDMKFQCKDALHKHIKTSHKIKSDGRICHICGKKSKTPNALKAHFNCHIQKQCPYCSKLLKTHSHFKIHVRNHVSSVKRKRRQTSYKCNDCTFTSLNKGSLEAHINKVHLGVRPHVCPICCKGFFKKSNLTEHVSIHEKVKNETCEVCGDNFVSKKTLLEHLRLHSNEMPYECLICFRRFVTSGRRSDHVKRKHMEKTECCMFCNKMFSLRKELNRHIKKVHGQNSVPDGMNTSCVLP